MTNRQIKIKSTGSHVATLKKGGKVIEYKNPVAQERAKIMLNHYKYTPIVVDAFTLKSNNNR